MTMTVGTGVMNAGNRIEYVKDRVQNNVGATVATAGTLAATGGAAYLVSKAKPQTIAKVTNPVANVIKRLSKKLFKYVKQEKVVTPGTRPALQKGFFNKLLNKSGTIVRKAGNFLKNNPKTAVIGGILIAGAGVLNAVLNKQSYNNGRIDQKFEDRAVIQEYIG